MVLLIVRFFRRTKICSENSLTVEEIKNVLVINIVSCQGKLWKY